MANVAESVRTRRRDEHIHRVRDGNGVADGERVDRQIDRVACGAVDDTGRGTRRDDDATGVQTEVRRVQNIEDARVERRRRVAGVRIGDRQFVRHHKAIGGDDILHNLNVRLDDGDAGRRQVRRVRGIDDDRRFAVAEAIAVGIVDDVDVGVVREHGDVVIEVRCSLVARLVRDEHVVLDHHILDVIIAVGVGDVAEAEEDVLATDVDDRIARRAAGVQ